MGYGPSRAAGGAQSGASATSLPISRRSWLRGAGRAGLAFALSGANAGALRAQPLAAPWPEFTVQTASEQQILDDVSRGLTVFRFADDDRIVVLDFPSQSRQSVMLDRVFAMAEMAGVPHDHVLTKAELDDAIGASGIDTQYYVGHDYSATLVQRVFSLAREEKLTLNSDEERLRRLCAQEGLLEPGKPAALISITQSGHSDALSDTDLPSAPRIALCHELAQACSSAIRTMPAALGSALKFRD